MLSRLRSWVRQIGSPSLRPNDAVVVALSIFMPIQLGYAAITYYMLRNPAAAPFLDLDWMRTNLTLQVAIALPGSSVLLGFGLVARKRWPDSPLLAHATMQCAAASVAFGSYSFGHSTDIFGPMAVFAVTVMGLLLFEASIVRASLPLCLRGGPGSHGTDGGSLPPSRQPPYRPMSWSWQRSRRA